MDSDSSRRFKAAPLILSGASRKYLSLRLERRQCRSAIMLSREHEMRLNVAAFNREHNERPTTLLLSNHPQGSNYGGSSSFVVFEIFDLLQPLFGCFFGLIRPA